MLRLITILVIAIAFVCQTSCTFVDSKEPNADNSVSATPARFLYDLAAGGFFEVVDLVEVPLGGVGLE